MSDHETAASDVSFGAWIQERRKALDLTQHELAGRIGCSPSTIRKIESDQRRPSRQLAQLLARELQLAPDQRELFLQVARAMLRVDRLPPPIPDAAGELSRPFSTLPSPPTTFVGREPELAALAEMVGDPQCRLCTLAGPGGIGKTRLAIELAFREQDRFPDGVCFVPLASLTAPSFLVPTVADALGFALHGTVEPRLQLLNYLRRKQMLLVLDNVEHLLAGVGLFAEILECAPGIKLLATSRERLRLHGEWVFEVQGLPVPSGGQVEQLENYSAVALFIRSGQRVQAGFELDPEEHLFVARICQLVGGMPLGIELAAAWVAILSCREIAQEIERNLDFLATSMWDVPERQRSLRAAFDHSWKLLSADERSVLCRLAIFRGGFSRQAADQVAGATLPILAELVSKSLVRRTETGRYDLHQVIQKFSAENLESLSLYGQLSANHGRYYLNALHQREADLKGLRQLEALDEIESDLGNIRAAWKWAADQRDEASIDRGLEGLYLFFYIRSRSQEGADLLHQAQHKMGRDDRSRVNRRVLVRRSLLRCNYQTDQDIEKDIRSGLALAQEHEDRAEVALALFALGYCRLLVDRDCAGALRYFEQCLEAFSTLDDRFYIARTLHRIGYCKSSIGSHHEYVEYTRQSLELAQAIGDKVDAAWALGNLASAALHTGDYDTAEQSLERSIALAREIGDRAGVAHDTTQLGLAHFLRGDINGAETLAASALSTATDISNSTIIAYALAVLALRPAVAGDYPLALKLGLESQAMPSNLFGVWLARWAMAIAHCGLRDFDSARQDVTYLLEVTLRQRWSGSMTWPMPIAAIILAQQGQESRAAELVALAGTHPNSPTGWMERWALMAELQARLQVELSPESYKGAWARALEMDLDATATGLVAHFAEDS